MTEAPSAPVSVLFDALQKAGISDKYAASDAETQAEKIANDLAEFHGEKGKAPEQYDFAGPADLVHPDGLEWKPGARDPLFIENISKIFKDKGLTQADAQPMIDEFKAHRVREAHAEKAQQQKAAEAQTADLQTLGPDSGKAMVDAHFKALDGIYGEGAADAFRKGGSARQVQIMDDLIANKLGAGRSAPTRGQNAPAKPDLSKLNGRELLRQSYQKKG